MTTATARSSTHHRSHTPARPRPNGPPRASARIRRIDTARRRAVTTDALETAAPAVPVPVTWGGHTVDAPGFDQDQFERAMTRAFVDDLRIRPLPGRAYLVHRPGATHGHRVTRETCSCPAGEHDVPCKHRAVLIAHLDIRVPQMARRWARRLRARQAEPERQAA